jgi:branched-chain amino acid transport system ATP-binding protein
VSLLEVHNLRRSFGGLVALAGVDLALEPGEVLGLVGPNGSGKTTLINTICGLHRPDAGEILLEGRSITGLAPHRLARLGIGRTFQIPRPFRGLTVAENLEVAEAGRRGSGPGVDEVLERVGLAPLRNEEAGALTATNQKLLDLARALMLAPRVIFVDELAAGLSPAELTSIAALLRAIASDGPAMVIVEHLLGFLEQVADHVIVLNAGTPIFRGPLREALVDPEVERVFLGTVSSAER